MQKLTGIYRTKNPNLWSNFYLRKLLDISNLRIVEIKTIALEKQLKLL